MIKKLISKLKKVKMTDYDLGILHGSEGREAQKQSKLYLMGYRCRANLSNLQTNKSKTLSG